MFKQSPCNWPGHHKKDASTTKGQIYWINLKTEIWGCSLGLLPETTPTRTPCPVSLSFHPASCTLGCLPCSLGVENINYLWQPKELLAHDWVFRILFVPTERAPHAFTDRIPTYWLDCWEIHGQQKIYSSKYHVPCVRLGSVKNTTELDSRILLSN